MVVEDELVDNDHEEEVQHSVGPQRTLKHGVGLVVLAPKAKREINGQTKAMLTQAIVCAPAVWVSKSNKTCSKAQKIKPN